MPVWAAWTSRTTLWPPRTLGYVVPEQNLSYILPRTDVLLPAKFEHRRSKVVTTYREPTHASTHSHLNYID